MTVTEFNANLTKIEQRLLNLGDEITRQGATLCADIADRVINEGKGADGGKFSPYSTNEVPAFWYVGRSLNAGGEAKIKAAAKKKQGVSYKDFREFNNRPTDKKNFSFSNDMWRGFGVKDVKFTGGVYSLEIGGQNAESQEKIDWMSGQEGRSIIAASRDELSRLNKSLTKQVLR
jgi:hypothetical protein